MSRCKKIISCLLFVLGIMSTSSCSSSLKEVTINSLKEGLQFLSQKKNYTFQYVNASDNSNCYIMFESKSIGFKVDGQDDKQYHYIKDRKGIYPLTYGDQYIAGEYLRDSSDKLFTSLWDNSFYSTLYGVEKEYVNSIDDSLSELTITNKRYKVALTKTLGYSDSDYLDVEYIKCSYQDNTLHFEIKLLKKNATIYRLMNLNSTVNEDVQSYLKNGGKVFTPSNELSKFRTLIRGNNFTRDIYDINTKSYVGLEVFHQHYFYSEIYAYNSGSGAVELNQKVNNEHNFDLYGCYNFDTTGSVKTAITNISLYPNASYETPNIELMYHYPTYLSILDNLQFLKEGAIEQGSYQSVGKTYLIKDMVYIYDFIYNFSFDSSYDPSIYTPQSLALDIDIQNQDSDSKITFIYYFTYGNSLYEVIVPLYHFNSSNIPLLDDIYTRFNG